MALRVESQPPIDPARAVDADPLGALIARHREGDPTALNALLKSVYPQVNRFVFRLVGLGPDRDDLVQNCLEQLCRALHRFDGRARVSTFVFAVCHRVVGRHQRAERVRRFFRLRAEESLLPEQRPEPDALLEHTQAVQEARRALRLLDDEERTVFVLHELESLPLAEVALALGCSTRTVKRRLQSARAKFEQPERKVFHE